MPISDIEYSRSEQEFQPLSVWAKRLSIPAQTLLHHAAQGALQLFVRPTFSNVDYWSVHVNFIEASGRLDEMSESLAIEGQAIYMTPGEQVLGLIISGEEYVALASERRIAKKYFNAIIRKSLHWGDVVGPIPGRLGNSLRPEGWRIAAIKRDGSASPPTDQLVAAPITTKIGPSDVYARDVDVQDFIGKVTSYQFISELCPKGEVIEDLPPYISKMLGEMIDVNRIFWRNHSKFDPAEREKRRTDAQMHLEAEFFKWRDEKTSTSPHGLARFAVEVCDRTVVPTSLDWSPYTTPELLALVTAAKLYWSPSHVDLEIPDTHPDRENMVSFLKFMGLTRSNDASSGVTVIRPDTAARHAKRQKEPASAPYRGRGVRKDYPWRKGNPLQDQE